MKKAYKLVKYVKTKLGTPYIYGAKQPYEFNKKYSLEDIKGFRRLYNNIILDSDFKKANKVVCDCSGLICAYTEKQKNSWELYNTATKKWQIRNANKLDINTLKKVPIGAVLWQAGHVGVFIGFKGKVPYYIAEDGSKYGCRKARVASSSFTHALLIKDITYAIKETYIVTLKHKTKVYKTSKATKKSKTYKKGTVVRIMAEHNGRGLLMKHSASANEWVDLKDLV